MRLGRKTAPQKDTNRHGGKPLLFNEPNTARVYFAGKAGNLDGIIDTQVWAIVCNRVDVNLRDPVSPSGSSQSRRKMIRCRTNLWKFVKRAYAAGDFPDTRQP